MPARRSRAAPRRRPAAAGLPLPLPLLLAAACAALLLPHRAAAALMYRGARAFPVGGPRLALNTILKTDASTQVGRAEGERPPRAPGALTGSEQRAEAAATPGAAPPRAASARAAATRDAAATSLPSPLASWTRT
jgi:hypothetical protein